MVMRKDRYGATVLTLCTSRFGHETPIKCRTESQQASGRSTRSLCCRWAPWTLPKRGIRANRLPFSSGIV